MNRGDRVVVTGGAGFIGSVLVDQLVTLGLRVTVLDDFNDYYSPDLKRANLANALKTGLVDVVEGDICIPADVRKALEIGEPQAVIHLAARAGVRPSIASPELYYQVNCMGTVNLFKTCLQHGLKRIIFASSSSVYGEAEQVPFHEEMKVDRPVSPYAASKQAGEALAHSFAAVEQMDIACLRFFTVYGPRQRPEMAIHHFMSAVKEGREITLFGDGSTSRDYTYVGDIVRGIVLALDKAKGFRIYNVGSGAPIQLLPLVELIGETLGKTPRITLAPMQKGDVSRTYADVSRATEELGFVPEVTLREGLIRMANWMDSN